MLLSESRIWLRLGLVDRLRGGFAIDKVRAVWEVVVLSLTVETALLVLEDLVFEACGSILEI